MQHIEIPLPSRTGTSLLASQLRARCLKTQLMQLEREIQAPLPTKVIGKLLNDRGLEWGLKGALLEGHGQTVVEARAT